MKSRAGFPFARGGQVGDVVKATNTGTGWCFYSVLYRLGPSRSFAVLGVGRRRV